MTTKGSAKTVSSERSPFYWDTSRLLNSAPFFFVYNRLVKMVAREGIRVIETLSPNIEFACAEKVRGERLIYLQKAWCHCPITLIWLLSHELSHHLLFHSGGRLHNCGDQNELQKLREFEADTLAAAIIRRLSRQIKARYMSR